MKLGIVFVALTLVALGPVLAPRLARAADCYNCAKDSSGVCGGADQCKGSREECIKAGCKISGTASCSTAANVKKCLSAYPELDGEPLSTPADPADHACFAGCED